MRPERPVSLAAYAKYRGCSRAAVRKAISTGRLVDSVTRLENGHWAINAALADKEWAQHTNPEQQRENHRAHAEDSAQGTLFEQDPERALDGKGEGPNVNGMPLTAETQRRKMYYESELRRLEVDERKGNSVSMSDLRAVAFRCARAVRDALSLLPDRLAPRVAALSDVAAIHALLHHEIVERTIRVLATEGLEGLGLDQPGESDS